MSVRQERVSMPVGSAGLLGFSDVKIQGMEIDPKLLLIGAFLFVVIVKLAVVMSGI
ncbi:preprotein translocase subunit Sec61beta [Candidatus Micrarchaeota archaeon]|nr:preprotein translocase subunit Sec61beta [Candidatus Micrarchaeota archaeon]